MNYRKDCYVNESTQEDNKDPRERLENFVIDNLAHIDRDAILKDTPNLSTDDENNWLREFVRANDPYEVLKICFFEEALKDLAEEKHGIPRYESDIVAETLYKLGFKKKIEPTGLFQHNENLEQIKDNVLKMTEAADDILRKLFLFYSYTLRWKAPYEEEVNAPEDGGDTDDTDKADTEVDPIHAIEKLIKQYRNQATKQLGNLYQWLKELMTLVEKNNGLTNYCQKHFQREVPLNQSQIAEIGMFRTYRNLVGSGHLPDSKSWEKHKNRAKIDLSNMDATTLDEWSTNWNYVVSQYQSNQTLPKQVMLDRMAMFFEKFLNSLSENQIYPKVIVMRDYEVDTYGTVKINAVTSDPNETVVLTDCAFFEPFNEYYYHSRTNPVGIEPILVPKEELDDWGTQEKEDTEKQEEV